MCPSRVTDPWVKRDTEVPAAVVSSGVRVTDYVIAMRKIGTFDGVFGYPAILAA
jgi:hypothetical protein